MNEPKKEKKGNDDNKNLKLYISSFTHQRIRRAPGALGLSFPKIDHSERARISKLHIVFVVDCCDEFRKMWVPVVRQLRQRSPSLVDEAPISKI